MKLKKTMVSLALCGVLIFGNVIPAFADSARVVTLGANLTEEQKNKMLDYFGVKRNEVVVLEVNNQEERKYLEGIATEQQIGTKTFSCAYVEPTSQGKGINVKTANITWVNSSMVATTLSTAGMTDADCVIASIFPVSGTGALTGIMKAFEDATGETLDEEKKEIASEELITTGDLANDIGQDKATGVINDIKTEIIKNDTKDTVQIAETINNITNNYNVTLTSDQQQQIEDLMYKIANQDYDYKAMKSTLSNVKKNVEENLKEAGVKIDKGMLESIGSWFSSVGEWFSGIFSSDDKDLGILGETNDSILGDDVNVDATDKNAIVDNIKEESKGFFSKVWDWVTNLFSSDDSNQDDQKNESNETNDINNNSDNINENNSMDNSSSDTINESDSNKSESVNTSSNIDNDTSDTLNEESDNKRTNKVEDNESNNNSVQNEVLSE